MELEIRNLLLVMISYIRFQIGCLPSLLWFGRCFVSMRSTDLMGFMLKEAEFLRLDFSRFLLIKFVVFPSYEQFNNLEALIFVQNLSFFLFLISLIYTVIEYKPLGLVRDVGIMFFGFAIAYLSVAGGAKIGTLVVALSLAIFDAIWVGLWRIFIVKKNPLNGDYTHFHHRLLGLGFTRGETRAFIWIWSFMMMVLMLLQGANRLHKIIIFVMMACLFFGLNAYLFLYKKMPCGLQVKKER